MTELNRMFLVGRLTADPDLRFTQNATPICGLRIACNRSWYDKATNEKKEDALFVSATLFGKGAEAAKKHLTKGREVLIEGRLAGDDWTDKNGTKHHSFRIMADRWQFVGHEQREDGETRLDTTTASEPAAGAESPDQLPF